MPQTVVVFGATGLIGASVATALMNHYQVKAVTRDISSPKAQGLKSTGLDVVQISDSNPQALDTVLKGASTCFVMTNTDFSDPNAEKAEFARGQAIAEACSRNCVGHVIYSTQLSVVKAIGLRVKHMDAKAQVESRMRELGLHVTGLIVPCLYESFLETPFRPQPYQDGTYGLDIPIGTRSLDLICSEDIGPVVREVLLQGSHWHNKTLTICGDKRTVPEVADILSCYCNTPVRDSQVTTEQWRKLYSFPGVEDYTNMFNFYMRVDQRASLELTKRLYGGLQSLEEWVAHNTGKLCTAMSHSASPVKDPWAMGL